MRTRTRRPEALLFLPTPMLACALMLALSGCATGGANKPASAAPSSSPAAGARSPGSSEPLSRGIEEPGIEAGAGAQEFDPGASAGLFVGVNEFESGFRWLSCAVDDAVDQAYLFSLELDLIAPGKITLALAGTPSKPETVQRLRELRAKGASVVAPTKAGIEAQAPRVAKSAGADGLLIFSVSSHGYQNTRGRDYIVAADSDIDSERISDTCVELSWLVYAAMSESPSPRRLAFIDACRERHMQARNIFGARASTRGMFSGRGPAANSALRRAMARHEGQAVFASAGAGELSYEADGNGVFTGALLEALRGGAPAGEDGLISVRELSERMNAQVAAWAGENPGARIAASGIETRFTGAAYRLPLAVGEASRPDPTPMPTPAPPRRRTGDIETLQLGGGVTMNLVWIEPGTFTMGSPESEEGHQDDEGPQTRVTLTEGFWMGQTEVTVGQFKRFVSETGYQTTAEKEDSAWADFSGDNSSWEDAKGASWKRPGFEQTDAHPVVCVSWDDAKAFCEWASGKAGVAHGMGLPTEAQWEYTCRGGMTGRFSFGDSDSQLGGYAWYYDNSDGWFSDRQTHPMGEKRPNRWGLYDMHGNVWEWCADWYFYSLPGDPQTNYLDLGPGDRRVFRGGSWLDSPRWLRSASRGGNSPGYRSSWLGFRVRVSASPR